ncbi:ACT domain-containing protein [Drosera capensis]
MATARAIIASTLVLRQPSLGDTRISRFDTIKNLPVIFNGLKQSSPLSFSLRKSFAAADSVNSFGSTSLISDLDSDGDPIPVVLIDQDTEPDTTIVQVSFGDRLGALIDTMRALKDLGLDVTKGTVTTEGSVKQTQFFITRPNSGRKVEDPDMLERIRLTIINNLLKYHPESSEKLALGEAFGVKPPGKKPDVDVTTHITVKEDGPKRSLLYIETADRPGLLLEIIKILADISIDVISAEIDTEGLVAKDIFHVSYRGAALNSSMSQASCVQDCHVLFP